MAFLTPYFFQNIQSDGLAQAQKTPRKKGGGSHLAKFKCLAKKVTLSRNDLTKAFYKNPRSLFKKAVGATL